MAAHTSAQVASQTISGPGYSFQVPPDWRQIPLLPASLRDASSALSSNNREGATVSVVHGPTPPSDLSASDATSALVDSGIAAGLSGQADANGPNFNVTSQPAPLTIPGADAAQTAAGQFTDRSGATMNQIVVSAASGLDGYLLILDFPNGNSDAASRAQAILSSFQITTSSSP